MWVFQCYHPVKVSGDPEVSPDSTCTLMPWEEWVSSFRELFGLGEDDWFEAVIDETS